MGDWRSFKQNPICISDPLTPQHEWFRDAKFGMMIHWGLYSLLGGEWKGQRTPYLGEWIQNRLNIPIKEYEPLAGAFNPIFFNAEEWVKLAADAGMQYIVITSKHHEGFALFRTKADPYNVIDATPFGRDVIAEMAAACRKYGVKLGLYYSQFVDWHEENGGGWQVDKDGPGKTWSNYWDFPDHSKKDYRITLEKKIKPQLREILTQYGKIDMLWCDTPYGEAPEYSEEIYRFVKSVSPDTLISSRCGNGFFDYHSLGDNEIPESPDPHFLAESPVTLNNTWGYKGYDTDYKSADKILEIKHHLNERGVNLLLNIGPDHLGRFPVPAIEVLRELARRRKAGEE